MKHVMGRSIEENIQSIDNIISNIDIKLDMVGRKSQVDNSSPFFYNSFIESATKSGDIICAYYALVSIDIKEAKLIIDMYKKDIDIFIKVSTVTVNGIENTTRIKVKQGINELSNAISISAGDKILISIEYPNEEEKPVGIWLALRGDIK